jgi:hypothetical protein
MILAATDESSCKDCHYVGAILCPETEERSLTAALDEVVRQAKDSYPALGDDVELHGYDLVSGKGDWQPLKTELRARIGVYDKAIQAIADHDVAIILRGVDVPRLNKRYGDWADDPHLVTTQHMLEKIDIYAKAREERVLVLADEPGQVGHQLRLRADLSTYRQRPTPGYLARKLTCIVDTIYFAPSSASRLLQAADLVVYMHHKIVTSGPTTDERAVRANHATWARIQHRVHHSHCWYP